MRDFGAEDYRKMRYTIETSNPDHIGMDRRWNSVMSNLKNQQERNKFDPIQMKERVRNEVNIVDP